MIGCIKCKIERAAREEFMNFLNWLSHKEYYGQIQAEYILFCDKRGV